MRKLVNKKFDAIGFDYGGVVAGITGNEFNKNVCKILKIDIETFKNNYFKLNHLVNSGEMERNKFWELLLEHLGKPNKHQDVIEYIDNLPKNQVNKDVLELINRLKSNGYKVGLLSNNDVEGAKKIREKLSDYFDTIVVSCEINTIKPSI